MSVEPRSKSYSQEVKDGAILAVASNNGYVKPTAEQIGIPVRTLQAWWNKYLEAAQDLTVRHKDGQGLADRFLAIAIAAQDRVMELLPETKSAYQAALIEGINLDKYLLLTGRPTSRTEILKARYVDPDALRKVSQEVIDVPAKELPETA